MPKLVSPCTLREKEAALHAAAVLCRLLCRLSQGRACPLLPPLPASPGPSIKCLLVPNAVLVLLCLQGLCRKVPGGLPGTASPRPPAHCPDQHLVAHCQASHGWGHGAGSAHDAGRMQFPCRAVTGAAQLTQTWWGCRDPAWHCHPSTHLQQCPRGLQALMCLPRPRCVPIWWHPAFPAEGRQPQTGVMLAQGAGGSWVPVLGRSLRWVPWAGEAAWPMLGASSNLISLPGLELELTTIPAAPKFPLPLSGAVLMGSDLPNRSKLNQKPAPAFACPHYPSTGGSLPAHQLCHSWHRSRTSPHCGHEGDTCDRCERQRCRSHVVTGWGSAWLLQEPGHQSWSLPVSLPWEKPLIQPAAMGWPRAGCAVPRVPFLDDALEKQRRAAGSRDCGTALLSSGAVGHQGASTVPFGWPQLLYGSGRCFVSWGGKSLVLEVWVGTASSPLSAPQQTDAGEWDRFPHPCHPPGA